MEDRYRFKDQRECSVKVRIYLSFRNKIQFGDAILKDCIYLRYKVMTVINVRMPSISKKIVSENRNSKE